jgi:hypothetical protein
MQPLHAHQSASSTSIRAGLHPRSDPPRAGSGPRTTGDDDAFGLNPVRRRRRRKPKPVASSAGGRNGKVRMGAVASDEISRAASRPASPISVPRCLPVDVRSA